MNPSPPSLNDAGQSGIAHAIGAYLIWGLLPLYLYLVRAVQPVEFFGWRILFTVPVCLAIVAISRERRTFIRALGNPRIMAMLTLSACLIGGNWLVYIIAIQQGHVFAASLGYYINPLVSVLAGTILLGERLGRLQWIAVAIAAVGVALLANGALQTLGISLTLAVTFCSYGLVRKVITIGALPGLTIESLVLAPLSIGIIAWQTDNLANTPLGKDIGFDLLVAASGIITAIPLLMFATAARRMAYSTLGFIQFLTPTAIFLFGLFVFHEPLSQVQLISFILIWVAIALFCLDMVKGASKGRLQT